MPNDFLYRLRLRDPDDAENYVDVLVCQAAAVRDAKTGAQEYGLIFDNSENGGRITHRHVVENPADPSQRIEVERIDGLILRDAKGDGELRGYVVNNNDPPPRRAEPQPGDPAHIRTHVVRYCRDNDPDGVPWVDVERIDCLALRDAKDFSQEFALIADWPQAGAPIDDPDDPFEPRFCEVPESLWLDDRDYERINPPWRLDPLQNIVNVMWSGAVEFQTAPAMARVRQQSTANGDFRKFTFSAFFNLAPETTFGGEVGHAYGLLHFGGSDIGSIFSPLTSFIRVGRVPSGEGTELVIHVLLRGPVFEIEWGTTPNFYGLIEEPPTKTLGICLDIRKSLAEFKPEWKSSEEGGDDGASFIDRYHHLAISIDASSQSFSSADKQVTWQWVWEFDAAVIDDNLVPISFSSYTQQHGVLDYNNSHYGSPVVDLRPNKLDIDALPDPNSMPGGRIYVIWIDVDGIFGTPGREIRSGYAGWPVTSVALAQVPFQMFLDGKDGYAEAGHVVDFNIVEIATSEDTSGHDGFIIAGTELAIPRQVRTQNPFDFEASDTRIRFAKMQIWFDQYVELSDEEKLARFITIKTDDDPESPTFGQDVLNPARFSAEEIEEMNNLNLPPEQRVSPAARTFGAPHFYLDGGPPSVDPETGQFLSPPTGFAKNRGTGGEMEPLNEFESFAAPRNIPVLT